MDITSSLTYLASRILSVTSLLLGREKKIRSRIESRPSGSRSSWSSTKRESSSPLRGTISRPA